MPNIERELLGMVGALEKFYYFTYGRPVTTLTDHKPLDLNFNESISQCTYQGCTEVAVKAK